LGADTCGAREDRPCDPEACNHHAAGHCSAVGHWVALTKSIARRNRNVAVQDFYLGLDFSSIAGGARLAEGTYIAVQIPEASTAIWSWKDWIYQPGSGQIVSRGDPSELIPYNCILFSVSRYKEEEDRAATPTNKSVAIKPAAAKRPPRQRRPA